MLTVETIAEFKQTPTMEPFCPSAKETLPMEPFNITLALYEGY
jgi:hypothetical protein